MALTPIDHDQISAGLYVHYKYSLTDSPPRGPYRVRLLSRDHEGSYVLLTTPLILETKIYLSYDEDYGQPVFYTETLQ